MNGRVYDPEIGRFLSADPHVQSPQASQSYNRYAYALNNPLKYTDPSGYFFKKLFKAVKKLFKNPIFRAVVGIAVAWWTFGAVSGALMNSAWSAAGGVMTVGQYTAATITANVLGGAAAGFAGGLIASGGDLKAAAIGAVSGAAFGFIGASELFGTVGEITKERVIAHGLVSGLESEASGGKFVHGFAQGSLVKSAAGKIQANFRGNPIGGAVASAVLGGTARAAMGGKFANGAVTAGFAYLFNGCGDGTCFDLAPDQELDQIFNDVLGDAETFFTEKIPTFFKELAVEMGIITVKYGPDVAAAVVLRCPTCTAGKAAGRASDVMTLGKAAGGDVGAAVSYGVAKGAEAIATGAGAPAGAAARVGVGAGYGSQQIYDKIEKQ